MRMIVCFKVAEERQEAFTTALKALGNWSNQIPGAWVLATNMRPNQVRDALAGSLQPGDKLFVAEITKRWSGRGMSATFPEWLQRQEEREEGGAKEDKKK